MWRQSQANSIREDPERFILALQNCQGRLDYKTLTAKPHITEEIAVPHTKGQKRPIIQCINGKFIAQYPSMSAAERAMGIKSTSIWKVLRGKRSTTGGYEWYYA